MPAGASGTLMSSSRTELAQIAERRAPTPEQFRSEILPGGQPVVMRGVANDWPLVIAGRDDPRKAMSMLEKGANGRLTGVLRAPPQLEGRFHDAEGDLQSFNYVRGEGNVAGIIAALREEETHYRPSAIAVQSMIAEAYFPGFVQSHTLQLVPPNVGPRLWIGNAAKVATHHDPIENVAVVAVGRRRFTLFPPSAEPDLYMGPKEPTPAGARISMVHVTAPDFERYPRFASALEVAQEAELSPGDAIFIPHDWYHHVEALDRFNVLVNYWWDAEAVA